MRRGAVVFVAWGLWLGVWTAVQLVFLHATFPERTIQWVMLGAAAAGATATGVAVWHFSRARREVPTTQLITDESTATATFAVGVAMALVGASFGLFLLLIGGGIAALGLGGLIREQLARARATQRREDPVSAAIPSASLARLLGSWNVDPDLIVLLAGCAATYLLATRRVRGGWPCARSAAFLAGLAVVATALMSGIDAYADYLLSVHMVEHMLLMMVAPVLVVWSAPVRLALAASRGRRRQAIAALLHNRVVGLVTRPAFGVTLLCTVMLGTYLTGLFELSLRNQTVHVLEHAAFFWSGVLCFAPLVAADPLPRPPGALARFGWLMVVMTAMVVAGALLSFDSSVRYRYYLGPARALHVSALADQQLAGVVMWYGGGLLGAALTLGLVTQALLAEERRQRRRERYATDTPTPVPSETPAVAP